MIDLKYLRNEAESTCRYSPPYMSRKELGELLDMLEAANLDAARYQWLASNISRGGIDLCAARFDWERRNHDILTGERLDSAIDAAMAATKGEEA